jgi:threonine dehydrogenase-like Zn-dependent dehydrogenase
VGDRVALQADGGYAEQVVVPAWWCVPVPEQLRNPAIIEPTGCLVGSVLRAGQQMGDVVVIVGGTGQMGEILQRLVLLHTPRALVVTGRREDALARAHELGAVAVNTNRDSLVDTVDDLTGGRGADVVYDVAGKENSLRLAVEVARVQGVLAEVGYPQGDLTVPQGIIVGKRLQRRNCHFTKEELVPAMRRAVDLFSCGAIDEEVLVSHYFGFDEIPDGFRMAAERPHGFRRWVAQIPS